MQKHFNIKKTTSLKINGIKCPESLKKLFLFFYLGHILLDMLARFNAAVVPHGQRQVIHDFLA